MELKKLLLLFSLVYYAAGATIKQVHPDLGLNAIQFIAKYGYPVEAHTIVTEDGYILETHRIPHGRNNRHRSDKIPILLFPGVVCASDIWVNMGLEGSLGFILADQGYDVWLANYRGTSWSMKHETLDAEVDKKEYFDFSFQEIGGYDVPANIDYILNVTQKSNLFYIGHSQGTTSFFALLSTKPEYQSKIRLMVGLAPVVYTTNIKHIVINLIKKYYDWVLEFIETYEVNEILSHSPLFSLLMQILCNDESFYQPICGEVLYFIAGVSTNFDESFIPVLTSNTPAGSTIRQIMHYVQTGMADNFQKYDFGATANMEKYGQFTPPPYDLKNITVPVALFYADQDTLSIVKDVQRLMEELPNVVFEKFIDGYNHVDYLWATNAAETVYNDLVEQIKKYS